MQFMKNTYYDKLEDFIKDAYYDFSNQPWKQGEYEDTLSVLVKHKDSKYYIINVEVEVIGQKQDYGDRVYHIEGIRSFDYKEVDSYWIENKIKAEYEAKRKNLEYQLSQIDNIIKSKLNTVLGK